MGTSRSLLCPLVTHGRAGESCGFQLPLERARQKSPRSLFRVLCAPCPVLGGVLLVFTSILHLMRLKLCLGRSLELCFPFPVDALM